VNGSSDSDAIRLRDQQIVCLSTIDWPFLRQGHQEIMSRLADAGNHVIFVENMGGVRNIRPTDTDRVVRRLFRGLGPRASRASGVAHLDLIAPILLPFPSSRLARSINRMLIRRLARRIRSMSGTDPILFTYLPTPEALDLIARLRGPRSELVYYCVADFAALAQDPSALLRSEAELAKAADLVFVQSAAFGDRFRPLTNRIFEFPGGVSLKRFDPQTVHEIPPEIRTLRPPIIGYVGGLHQHLDVDLLQRVARAMPSASLVLVGPILAAVDKLRAEPNVHFFGARPPAALPSLIASFDVGLIPYLRNQYTETVYPAKLFEYLAMGRPVVATDLPELRKLQLPQAALRIGLDSTTFVNAIREALSDTAADNAQLRRELARPHDWDSVVSKMADLIAEHQQHRAVTGGRPDTAGPAASR
jgi:glycosyltransferase involved in cell wall biosynthesis